MKMHSLYIQQKDSFITRLDARIKLLSALALLVMVLSCRGITFPLVVAGLGIGLSLSLGAGFRIILLRFAQPLLIAGAVLLLKLFSGETPLFSASFPGMTITAYVEGLRDGLQIAGRIIGAVSVAALVGFSTEFTDLMAALAWLRVPRGLIDVALFAWRYLFVLFEDAQVVYNAQKNRLGYTGFRRGLRSFGTLAGALVIKAFDNSQTITTAMVQRGYDGEMPLMRHRPLQLMEVVLSVLFVACVGFMWGL